jgi:hypothetical protein
MMSPYTTQPVDAIMAAQTSVGLVLGALLWFRKLTPRVATFLFGAAIALAVLASVSGEFLMGVGVPIEAGHTKRVLKIAAGCATLAALLTRREWLTIVALAGEGALWKITDYIQESDGELAAAYLAFFGLLLGVHWRTLPPEPTPAPASGAGAQGSSWSPSAEDAAAFAFATMAGMVVCRGLMHAGTDSADEWGYTFQAALFAKLHAYGTVPPCVDAFENYWVFEHMGRRFSQYTPGWPMFMAPFVAARAVWVAGPASFGILVAGIARLTRRAAAGFGLRAGPPPESQVRAAGRFAALAMLLSATLLINAGSRFPHLFVMGMYVWATEALFMIASGDLPPVGQWRWGAVLGVCASMMLAARPGDGATLGIGLFLYFVYALVRRRVGWRAVLAGAVPFAIIGGATLVILRLQIGTWFTTGYSLAAGIRSWAAPAYSIPNANQFKSGIPLATGSYCWWPCSPAVGLLGLAWLRGRARRVAFVLLFGLLPLSALYVMAEFGRGWDWGYGPRYALPLTIPMAIGTGVACARVWSAARANPVDRATVDAAAAFAVIVVAVLVGVARIAPLLYPFAYSDVAAHNRLSRGLEFGRIHRAVVVAEPNVSNASPLDLTENLPIDLYPDEDVLIANDHDPGTVQCLREHFRNRTFYRALAGEPARIIPLK